MKLSNSRTLTNHLILLKKKSPWMASLIQHCLETRNPKTCETMRQLLLRLRMNTA
ncbi:MAG: hypothetical protein ABH871_07310 [Pseudomonadota bacterium]